MRLGKKIIKIITVICIVIIIFNVAGEIIVEKTYPLKQNLNTEISPYILAQKADGFYELEKNTLDVVFLGSSHVHCSINPLIIWDKYKYTSYDFSADQQDMATAYYYCVDVFKTQKPQKIVVAIDDVPERQAESAAHFSFDFMPFSVNKIKGVLNRAPVGEYLSYLTPYLEYHSRWKELTQDDFKYIFYPKEHTFNGYFAYCISTKVIPQSDQKITKASVLSDIQKKYIDKLNELCKKNNCELIFIKTPSAIGNNYTELVNAIKEYVSEKKILVMDYSFDNRIGVDWNTDFADEIHANIYGAEKFSTVLGEDLIKGLKPIEQKETTIYKYDSNYKRYREYMKNYEANNN